MRTLRFLVPILILTVSAGCNGGTSRAENAAPAVSLEPVAVQLGFYLREGKSAANDARIVDTIEHGCQPIAVVDVPPMPVASDAFDLEEFFEIDADGGVLRRWNGPTDVFVVGANGGLLGLQDDRDHAFWLDAAGNLYRRPSIDLDAMQRIDCPAAAPMAGDDFQACVVVTDAESGARRTFAYQRPCT